MNFKRLLLFLAAPLALLASSCVTEEPEYTLPEIKVTDADGAAVTAINFPAEGGDQVVTITSTRSWNITSQAEWFAITPSSDTNSDMKEKVVEVTFTAAPNDEGARNETIKIAMDKTELSITVSQSGAGQVALGQVLYFDNFDKGGQAQKGSSGWDTYMDGDKGRGYCNPTPENQSGVSYTGTKVTVRSNSANGSGGTHSNYEGSGVNYLWFGTAPTNLTVSGISLAELEGNALTLSFGTERFEYNATDNTFKPEEFKVYISGDGEKWSQVEYTFLEGVNTNGKWNIATAQFNLKEVPESLSIYVEATVGAAYALDDLKLTAGGGGAEIDLSAGGAISGGNTGGGNTGGNEGGAATPSNPDPNAQQITVAQFNEAAEDSTIYLLTGTIGGSINTTYGNFDLTDATGTVYIYGLVDGNGNRVNWDATGLNAGDTITVQGTRGSYNGKVEMIDALYISHTDGEGGDDSGETPTPEPGVGPYASDSPFVCATGDSTNAAYGHGETAIDGNAVTGFKLGKGKQQGKFTSTAIGVSGDKYLNFYAVAWKGSSDVTLYWRVDGGAVQSQKLASHDGATGNPPYNALTARDTDHYSVMLSGLSESSTIEFSTNADFALTTHSGSAPDIAPRVLVFGVKLTDEALGGNTDGGTTEPEPEPSVVKATVAEFLVAAEDSTIYELTGTIKGTYNTFYGNFYLEDATGEVLIYGILQNGEKCYEALGLKDGDTLTIQGARASYNGTAQMKNAEYISHTAGGTTEPEPEPEPSDIIEATVLEFLNAAESTTQWYKLTGTIKNLANTTYGNFDLEDETGSIYVYGLTATQVSSNDKSFSSLGLKEGDIVTLIGTRASYNDSPQVGGPAYYVSHEAGEVVEPDGNTASVSFADAANRTSLTTEQQVWQQNGITVTGDKASSTNNVADYVGPARFYKGSNITVESEKAMSTIVFYCTGGSNYYLTLSDGSGYTVAGSATAEVTVNLTTPATSFKITGLANQTRLNKIEVTFAE